MELKDKVVVITGGSKGIGKAAAAAFLQEGAKVAIMATGKTDLDRAKEALDELGEVMAFRADVRDYRAIDDVVYEVRENLGEIDVLVNNAAISNHDNFLDQGIRDWNTEVDVNVKGVLNCIYAIGPHMTRLGDGVIINISSGAGKTGYPQLAVYSATKHAILGFTEGFAQEVAEDGVRVYAVLPGETATEMSDFEGMPPEKVAERIVETAKESLGIKPGEFTEIYE